MHKDGTEEKDKTRLKENNLVTIFVRILLKIRGNKQDQNQENIKNQIHILKKRVDELNNMPDPVEHAKEIDYILNNIEELRQMLDNLNKS